VMGDPSFQDQTNHIKIEGVTYTDTDPYDDDQAVDAFGDFDEVTRTVTITDGKLTLSPSSGCYNTKLMFIEVTPLSGGGGTATPGLAAATYKYDALGRRLQKTVGAVATTFVHDGDQVVAEYEGSTLKRRYIYGTYIDEPLAMVTSTGTQYYHQNRVYHVMAMTNSSGQLAERYGYTPYGKRRVVSPSGATLASSAVGNQVGFTGRYHDGETGLIYFRARYHDAELGRFVGRDPIAFADFPLLGRGQATASQFATGALTLYAFPHRAKAVDPNGTFAIALPFAIVGAAIAAVAVTIVVVVVAAVVSSDDADDEPIADAGDSVDRKSCNPCTPPLGTIAYRVDRTGKARKISATECIPTPHSHRHEVHQSPPEKGCICFWVPLDKHPIPGVLAPEMSPATGGGIAP